MNIVARESLPSIASTPKYGISRSSLANITRGKIVEFTTIDSATELG